ncbi:unnamed protein product [Zymoseptoria tritici ST99CH_1A5]|uniref:Aromatic-L-amino-acid decarboxylase n=1 Tax=Zymoseptoria tritici ST99CH_1A5 TaxID=1276529 RepID=A0A1Y6LFN1_ZYMTR|nr:unnamed protein product [Zymoseptoria tritici ST99CH_1A5]
MDSSTFRAAGHRAIEYIADYYEQLASGPVRSDVTPGFLLSKLPSEAPEKSEAWSAIESDLHHLIEPGLGHWMHPGFMAYFPASSSFEGILGELYSAAFNNPAFDWICSPSITELELAMGVWVGELLGLPPSFRGHASSVIQSTTTECLITTMCAARERMVNATVAEGDYETERLRSDDVRNRLVVLSSSETHVSTRKAAKVVGVQHRSIPCDPSDGIALSGTQLQTAVDECLAEGMIPFYFTAAFGTTNSCAVDDFPGIARVKEKHPEIWIHVDAAYAGAALACEEFRPLASGMDQFDSFSVNMGKWLLTNLDCTMLFARNRSDIVCSMKNDCSILQNPVSTSQKTTDYRDLQLSMGRRFRSLKVWFVLRSFGKQRIQHHIRRHVEMASHFTDWVRQRPDLFALTTEPRFALNVIRVSDAAASRMGTDSSSATAKLYDVISQSRRFWLSKTTINGCVSIRIIAANSNSDLDTLRHVFEVLSEGTQSLLDQSAIRSDGEDDGKRCTPQ